MVLQVLVLKINSNDKNPECPGPFQDLFQPEQRHVVDELLPLVLLVYGDVCHVPNVAAAGRVGGGAAAHEVGGGGGRGGGDAVRGGQGPGGCGERNNEDVEI